MEMRSLLNVPARERAAHLERWLEAQPDRDLAARALATELRAMENAPFHAEGSNATTELLHFLDAERIRFPLDEAAEQCTDLAAASELWCHAAVSSLLTGELADLAYCYAKRAVRAAPESANAWVIFAEGIRSYAMDLFDDVRTWRAEAEAGAIPRDVPAKALAAARSVVDDWEEDDRARLDELAREIG